MLKIDVPTTIVVDFLSLVRRADPDFERSRRRELAYHFERRDFYIDPEDSGAYALGLLNEDGSILTNEDGTPLEPDGTPFTKLQGNMGNFHIGVSEIGRESPE